MSPPASRPPQLISDELWGSLEPMLPPRPPQTRGRTGRPRTSDRDVLEGIAVVLNTGIGWAKLPPELGYGSGWTCWRRMREWKKAAVFEELYRAVLDRLGQRYVVQWSRACLDWVAVHAPEDPPGQAEQDPLGRRSSSPSRVDEHRARSTSS